MKEPTVFVKENAVRELLFIILKHKFKILVFFLGIMTAVIVWIRMTPVTYTSHAKLFVRMGQMAMLVDSNLTGGHEAIRVSQPFENQINSEIEILNSRELAQKVIESLGPQTFKDELQEKDDNLDFLPDVIRRSINNMAAWAKAAGQWVFGSRENHGIDTHEKQMDTLVDLFTSNLSAQVVADSNIIALSYTDDSPRRAQKILTRFIDIYLDKHLKVQATPGSYGFFKKESDSLLKDLKVAEKRVEMFKNKMGLGDIDVQENLLTAQVADLRKKIKETESLAAAMQTTINSPNPIGEYPDFLEAINAVNLKSSDVDKLRGQLYDLKMKEQDLLSTFTQESIPVREIRRQIGQVQALLQDAIKGMRGALMAQSAVFKRQLDNTQAQLRKVNAAQNTLMQYEREKDLVAANYKKYAESLEQTRINQALEKKKISNIVVAESPILPIDPTSAMPVGIKLLLAICIGLFGGMGWGFFVEYMNDSLQKPEQVEKVLELPVLGSVEKMRA